MTDHLFSEITLGGIALPNRIVVSPMCQYSAKGGVPQPWHRQHLGSLSLGGAGLVVIEATAVEAAGRITSGDTGLYDDAQEQAFAEIVRDIRGYSPARIGMQLAHAGRKASSRVPWEGGAPLTPEEGAWTTMAPSALPLTPDHPAPAELDAAGLERIKAGFAAAAKRALRIGIDAIELHGAHGYLIHSFVSPLSNRRTDSYGGSLSNRMRFPLEIAEAVRAVWPEDRILGARITGSDWRDDGLGVEDAVVFAQALEKVGLDYVAVSSGGAVLDAKIPIRPGYQVPFAERVKAETGLTVMAVGMILTPDQADEIVTRGQADMVALARGFLDDPRWGWHAAELLKAEIDYPPPYQRASAKLWRGAEVVRPQPVPPTTG